MELLPLFPLNLVVYPYEQLSLHVFEPRYKELMADCLEQESTFGIPSFVDDAVKEYGTEVKITEVVNTYPDGRMDVRVVGLQVIRISNFQAQLSNKLYAGGHVERLVLDDDSQLAERVLLIDHAERFFNHLKTEVPLSENEHYLSYAVAHKLGLSLKEEYHLLSLPLESERIQFLVDHLTRAIPIARELERVKQKVRMNGHFRNLNPLKF